MGDAARALLVPVACDEDRREAHELDQEGEQHAAVAAAVLVKPCFRNTRDGC